MPDAGLRDHRRWISSTARVRPRRVPMSGSVTDGSWRSARSTSRPARDRRLGPGGRPRASSTPTPTTTPRCCGTPLLAVVAARGHHVIGGNCGFTIAPMADGRAPTTSAHAGPGRGHAARGAQSGRAWDWALRRVARPARRTSPSTRGSWSGTRRSAALVHGERGVGELASEAPARPRWHDCSPVAGRGRARLLSSWARTHPTPTATRAVTGRRRGAAALAAPPCGPCGHDPRVHPPVARVPDDAPRPHGRHVAGRRPAAELERPAGRRLPARAGGAPAVGRRPGADAAPGSSPSPSPAHAPAPHRDRRCRARGHPPVVGGHRPARPRAAGRLRRPRRPGPPAGRLRGAPPATTLRRLLDWDGVVVGTTHDPANAGLEGRTVGHIARERGVDPIEALVRHRRGRRPAHRAVPHRPRATTRPAGR